VLSHDHRQSVTVAWPQYTVVCLAVPAVLTVCALSTGVVATQWAEDLFDICWFDTSRPSLAVWWFETPVLVATVVSLGYLYKGFRLLRAKTSGLMGPASSKRVHSPLVRYVWLAWPIPLVRALPVLSNTAFDITSAVSENGVSLTLWYILSTTSVLATVLGYAVPRGVMALRHRSHQASYTHAAESLHSTHASVPQTSQEAGVGIRPQTTV
ncbi:hypothetical protein KIPB_005070, partial [Kipferlia bialata]